VPSANTPTSSPSAQALTSSSPQALPHERFLALYLDETLTLADIAFTLSISIIEALARTEDPEFVKLLETYTAAQEKRNEALARANRATAARTFARLAEYSDKPETARKAAGDIIRMQDAKEKHELATRNTRIRAVQAYAKLPSPNVRDLLAPILGPPTPASNTPPPPPARSPSAPSPAAARSP
jgi:hypothetical protein